jgi:hypothetical protein
MWLTLLLLVVAGMIFSTEVSVIASPPTEQITYTLVRLRGKTWTEAENYCWNVFGKHLAMILNADEAGEVQRLLDVGTIWIGLHEQWNQDQWNQAGSKRIWVWSTNSSLATRSKYSAWVGNRDTPPDPPVNDLRPRCAVMYSSSYWNPMSCDDFTGTDGFLCDKVTDKIPAPVAPFTQEGPLLFSPPELRNIGDNNGFGSSIAMNSAGNILIAGSPKQNNNIGVTFVYFQGDGNWTMHSKLVGADYERSSGQGTSVAVSSSGDVVLIGGPHDALNTGAGWIFMRADDGEWYQFGSKLVGDDASFSSNAGAIVALSSDGNCVAIAGYSPNTNSAQTNIWMFWNSSPEGYKQFGSKLLGWYSNYYVATKQITFAGNTNYFVTPTNQTHVRIYERNDKLWVVQQDFEGAFALMSEDSRTFVVQKVIMYSYLELRIYKRNVAGFWTQQGTGFSIYTTNSNVSPMLGMSGDGSRIIIQTNTAGSYDRGIPWLAMFDFARGGKILDVVPSTVVSSWYSFCPPYFGAVSVSAFAMDTRGNTIAVSVGCNNFIAILDQNNNPTTPSPSPQTTITFPTPFPTTPSSSFKPTHQPLKLITDEPTTTTSQSSQPPTTTITDLNCSTLQSITLCKSDSRCKWKSTKKKCIDVSGSKNLRSG